jgi:hypothetical protein
MDVDIELDAPNALILEIALNNHWIRLWVGFRADLGVATKRKILVPARNRTLGLQPVATHYAD